MTLKDQWKTVKDNWLLVLVVLVIMAFLSLGGSTGSIMQNFAGSSAGYGGVYMESASMDMAYAPKATAVRSYMPLYDESFAPEVQDRKITKTAWLSTEIKRDTFSQAEQQLKDVLKASDSFLLDENVNKYGVGRKQYYQGSYSIKVEADKYASVISQLKQIGEIQSFSENADDITGSYTDIQVELEAEKERLKRYQEMYAEAVDVEDKINLNDRIFSQERTIKYYEQRLEGMDTRVDYSTIQFSMQEKQSEYVDAIFVKFSELITDLVRSINSVLTLLFVILPYAIAVGLIVLIVRLVRRKKGRK